MDAECPCIGDEAREPYHFLRFGLGFAWSSLQHVTEGELSFVTLQTQKESVVTFSANLRRLMTERGLNASELGRKARLSHVAIRNYLLGRTPKSEALRRLADVLQVTLDDLLRGNPSSSSSPATTSSAPTDTATVDSQSFGTPPPRPPSHRSARDRTIEALDGGNKLPASPEFQRIEHLRQVGNFTWEQVSKELALSVGMLMMIKSGKRRMSLKSHYRLSEAEKRAGIESYESLTRKQLLERKADTETGSLADFLRTDELPRYIANLERDLENCRRMVSLAQQSSSSVEDQLRRARLALAQKLRNEKDSSANVGGNIPDTPKEQQLPLTMEEVIQAADAAIAEAKVDAEAARAEAADAKALLEEYERIDAQLEAEMAEIEKDLPPPYDVPTAFSSEEQGRSNAA